MIHANLWKLCSSFLLCLYTIFSVYRLFKRLYLVCENFLKKKFKKTKKSVDIWERLWYYKQAVARERRKNPIKWGFSRKTRVENECSEDWIPESKFKENSKNFRKKFKKVLIIAWRYDKILKLSHESDEKLKGFSIKKRVKSE